MYATPEELKVVNHSELRTALDRLYQNDVAGCAARIRVMKELERIVSGVSGIAGYAISAASRANAKLLRIVIAEFHDAAVSYTALSILGSSKTKAAMKWRRDNGYIDEWSGPVEPKILSSPEIAARMLISLQVATAMQPLLVARIIDATEDPKVLEKRRKENGSYSGAVGDLLDFEANKAGAIEERIEKGLGTGTPVQA